MKDFLAEMVKLIFAAAIVLVGLGYIVIVFLEDEESSLQFDAQHIQSWLNEIDAEEERGFKAETLKEECNSKNVTDKAWCTGYLLGFVEGHQIAREPIFCLDGQFSSDQLGQSFKNFMEAHPQYWGKSRSAVLTGALQKSFPCD